MDDVVEIFKRTPYLADLKPGGQYVAKDVYEAGGVPIIIKTLYEGGFIHGDCLTVTGKTIAEIVSESEKIESGNIRQKICPATFKQCDQELR